MCTEILKIIVLYVGWLAGRPRRRWEDNTAIDTT
jgi:hypothetical protein